MDSYRIYNQANSLIRQYKTTDPLEIAESMGIIVHDVPELKGLLGMYTYKMKNRIIFMNPNINEVLYRMVLGHEIGHDQLHRALAGGEGLREFELFDMNDMIEYEANAFNAHLLIDEDDMDALFREGYDLASSAKMLKVNINLLLIKIQEMNKLGMNLKLPYSPDARFFRHTTE